MHDGWPVTSAEDTVLDLVAGLRSPHVVVAVLTDACRTSVVSVEEILRAMGRRKRQRHRQLVKDVLADVIGGLESNLDHEYLVKVERPHAVTIRKDVEYDEFATIVELDGRVGHEGSGQHRDRRRDNAGARRGKSTLRYGHADLAEACEVAGEVAVVLTDHGWTGQLTCCSLSSTVTEG